MTDTNDSIKVIRGDTPTITVTVKDSTGTVVDLTNYTMKFTVKRSTADTNANAVIGPVTMTIASPTTGIGTTTLTVTHTDLPPRKYFYDVQINNSTTAVHTVVGPATFEIVDDVTKA
jgi:hypothetical protein